jgi:hypothetical protein
MATVVAPGRDFKLYRFQMYEDCWTPQYTKCAEGIIKKSADSNLDEPP